MQVSDDIADFGETELDDLGDCLFGKPFLAFVEEEHRGRARALYFHERDSDGRLIAFAPAYVYHRHVPLTFRIGEFTGDPALVERAPAHLIVGVPVRLRSRIHATGPEALRTFVGEITEWAAANAFDAVVLPFALGSDGALAEALERAGFARAFYEGDFYLPVAGADIDEFLSSLPRGPRKRLRNDMNHFLRSGIELVRPENADELAAVMADQHRALMDKYRRPEVEFTEESFRRFDRLVPSATWCGARTQDALAGYSMGFHGHGVLNVLRYGNSGANQDDARVYVNVGYVEPVRIAIELGLERVHFGKSAHHVKVLRGCLHEEGFVYAKFLQQDAQDDITRTFARLDAQNRHRFAALSRGEQP
ncbi:hypothetical protein ACFV7Q_11360 [Streptomyces sp. NPDC059851]|uniref:hypothetical protein n=1 Tax=Streptomyces sp. NPDC059851 TaxID=3346971 RepID=UPI003665DC4B